MAKEMHAQSGVIRGKAGNQFAETVLSDDASALLHLPIRSDAHDVLGAVPEFLEVVGEANRASLARATFFGVVRNLAKQLAPFLVAQRGDARFGVVGRARVDRPTALTRQKLAKL